MVEQRLCASACAPGTFEETEGICMNCSDTCNTCEVRASQCTSCFHDKTTLVDLYFVESDNSCKETCPNFTEKDYLMHECNSIAAEVFSITSWPMLLLIAAVMVPITLLIISRLVSSQMDESLDLSAGLFTISEGVVKASFWVALWQAQHLMLFSVIGVSAVCSSLLSIIFYETTLLPVREAIDDKRAGKGFESDYSRGHVWAIRLARLLAYLSNIHVLRLLSSAFCGSNTLSIDFALESPCFYLKRRVQANKA